MFSVLDLAPGLRWFPVLGATVIVNVLFVTSCRFLSAYVYFLCIACLYHVLFLFYTVPVYVLMFSVLVPWHRAFFVYIL